MNNKYTAIPDFGSDSKYLIKMMVSFLENIFNCFKKTVLCCVRVFLVSLRKYLWFICFKWSNKYDFVGTPVMVKSLINICF